MIGYLPKVLNVNGVEHPINSDYRVALTIFEAMNDPELSPMNKALTMLEILYNFQIPEDLIEAQKQALWFLNIGDRKSKQDSVTPRTMDYKQDEHLLFSAVNAVVGHDVREDEYCHWWTFYGYCQAISSESLLSHIISIRHKLGAGTKLEKWEQKFYRENRHLIDMDVAKHDYEELVRHLRGE